jgi:hypothetical protein
MDSGKAGSWLILLGLISGCIGFLSGNLFLFNLFYVGISWVIAGLLYLLAGREVTGGGFLAAFILGTLGAIAWLIIDVSKHSHNYYGTESRTDILEARIKDLEEILREKETGVRNINQAIKEEDQKILSSILNRTPTVSTANVIEALTKKYENEGHLLPEQYLESKINEKMKSNRSQVLEGIYKDESGAKVVPSGSEGVVSALVWKYREEGYLHPELYLEGQVERRKKTREQVLQELYGEEIMELRDTRQNLG